MSDIIGVIVPTVDNSFFANLAYSIEKDLSKKGYQTLICSSANNAEKEKEYYQTLLDAHVKGILSVSGLSTLPEGILPEGYPLVWLDRVPLSKQEIPWVANDDAYAMEQAAELLLQKGCRHIVLAPGYLAENRESPRVTGYKRALKKNAIEYDETYILKRKGTGTSEAETQALVQDMMREGKTVDGIITSSDRAAFGAIAALNTVGYYVPEDVRLITFDNSPYSIMSSPSITSIDRNSDQLSERATEILIERIEGRQIKIENIISVSLIERDSTR